MIGIKTENPKGKGFKTAFPEKNRFNIPNYRHYTEYDQRLRHIWYGMRDRCNNPNNHAYKDYGGRNPPIKICKEWDYSYGGLYNFIEWAYEDGGYYDQPPDTPRSKLLTIDREKNWLGYSPDNCRFVTPKEQANNTRNNTLISYNNETHSIAEWADITGMPYYSIGYRYRAGMDLDVVFSKKNIRQQYHEYKGKMYTLQELSKQYNIPVKTIENRIKLGWNLEDAVDTPILSSHDIGTKILTYNGISLSVTDWANIIGVDRSLLYNRLRYGKSIEYTLCTPVNSKECRAPWITDELYVKDGHFYDKDGFMRLVFKRR